MSRARGKKGEAGGVGFGFVDVEVQIVVVLGVRGKGAR